MGRCCVSNCRLGNTVFNALTLQFGTKLRWITHFSFPSSFVKSFDWVIRRSFVIENNYIQYFLRSSGWSNNVTFPVSSKAVCGSHRRSHRCGSHNMAWHAKTSAERNLWIADMKCPTLKHSYWLVRIQLQFCYTTQVCEANLVANGHSELYAVNTQTKMYWAKII